MTHCITLLFYNKIGTYIYIYNLIYLIMMNFHFNHFHIIVCKELKEKYFKNSIISYIT